VSLEPENDWLAVIPPVANAFAKACAGSLFPAASTGETMIVAFSEGA